jgi:hypothetical protein
MYNLRKSATILAVADGSLSEEELVAWFRGNIQELNDSFVET